ncbi:hypothetical protein BU24DRAFT_351067 [Aaosphaeria arxii CBS 175.79]|uniref:Fungal N-terminal domain-containing protein n=1 Tax=Aaosphaeria arxii CBS 175.79 TaxID=1450172 RepID=A0A6A5XLA1_9PLEO|nr:uncharacterized protein BU24DRAFT_351067 [Aaosphaeria arxii CBS 175.79]KAF2013587.1 hypothetical protein BU24DRAFT_351067 [Aaosphaeria arxii CBS 175.79]
MSFGVSPSDIVKLVEFSTRIYVAFKDANDNSEAQVEALVREFSNFHECLVQLDELMKEYGKPLPFPYLDFKETLEKCDKTLKGYATHLVDNKKMTPKKFVYTIKYIGKEKEIDGLRKQLSGHYQATQMCISFLQLRLHLEATKQTQRLLDSAPFRAMSFGGQMYSSNAFASSSRATPNALPPPSEADQLYKDWLVFNRWLKSEDERIVRENDLVSRPLSLGNTPAIAPSGDTETAAVLYHLRRELEDAILIEENRAKRVAIEKTRNSLSPNDAIRKEVKAMPQVPQRTYTLDTDHSGDFSRFRESSLSSLNTAMQQSPTASLTTSPTGSPQIPANHFHPIDWNNNTANDMNRTLSVSTVHSNASSRLFSISSIGSEASQSPDGHNNGLAISTPGTTPENPALHHRLSNASLATMALGEGALTWTKLGRKVDVERTSSKGVERKQCDLHWRYNEEAGLSIRAVFRSGKEVKVFITQSFPATGPSIPLTTSSLDGGETCINFPRSSYGHLDKRATDIKYTFPTQESSHPLQTLLYTNNGKDDAELLYDRPVLTVSSDKNKPECRMKNIRLWRRTEDLDAVNGPVSADVLVLLFYTSALPEGKGHWVEEPHYIFQWLDDAVYKKVSDKLVLVVSKEPGKWNRDKIFKRRISSSNDVSSPSSSAAQSNAIAIRRTSAVPMIRRTDTGVSSSSAMSVKSTLSVFGGKPSKAANLNRFGYSELEIKFQSKKDRMDFLEIWKQYVKPLGMVDGG